MLADSHVRTAHSSPRLHATDAKLARSRLLYLRMLFRSILSARCLLDPRPSTHGSERCARRSRATTPAGAPSWRRVRGPWKWAASMNHHDRKGRGIGAMHLQRNWSPRVFV